MQVRHKKCRFDPWVRKIPWKKEWQPSLVFLPGESYGERNLMGYSPWSHKESDTTEQVNNNKCVYTLRIYLQHGQMFRVSTYKSKIQALITS